MTSLAISVRELSTPCHLAHGLLDYAQYLTRTRDAEGAAAAIKEARAIAGRLRCQPLLDRAADIAPANPRCRIRSRRYLIWKSPPARPGSLRPQRPDYAGPDTSRMILMDRGFGRELLAHWDTDRRDCAPGPSPAPITHREREQLEMRCRALITRVIFATYWPGSVW
jgi:hypothetical protein